MSGIPFRNAEGYPDPTAHAAMTTVLRQQDEADQRLAQLIKTLKNVIDLADFDLLERIEVRDRETGRVYR
jgi:hypothetical protein